MDEAEATTLSIDATTLFTIGDYQEASKLWGKSAGLFEKCGKTSRATIARRACDKALEALRAERIGPNDSGLIGERKEWEWDLDEATERFCDK